MSARARLLASCALPVLGLLFLVLRAQWIVTTGTLWRLPIEGYDPRDLLSGHYLTFRFAFEKSQPPNCYSGRTFSCCVCLQPGSEGRVNPYVTWLESCPTDVHATCESFIPAEAMTYLHRYYIPENAGYELEQAVREKKASIELSVRRDGRAVISKLYVGP